MTLDLSTVGLGTDSASKPVRLSVLLVKNERAENMRR
jgi:hypothetical protein